MRPTRHLLRLAAATWLVTGAVAGTAAALAAPAGEGSPVVAESTVDGTVHPLEQTPAPTPAALATPGDREVVAAPAATPTATTVPATPGAPVVALPPTAGLVFVLPIPATAGPTSPPAPAPPPASPRPAPHTPVPTPAPPPAPTPAPTPSPMPAPSPTPVPSPNPPPPIGSRPAYTHDQVVAIIQAAAQRHGDDPIRLVNLASCESGLQVYAQNPSGPFDGLFQFYPSTFTAHGGTNIWDPYQQADIAATMIASGQAHAWGCPY